MHLDLKCLMDTVPTVRHFTCARIESALGSLFQKRIFLGGIVPAATRVLACELILTVPTGRHSWVPHTFSLEVEVVGETAYYCTVLWCLADVFLSTTCNVCTRSCTAMSSSSSLLMWWWVGVMYERLSSQAHRKLVSQMVKPV